MPAIARVGVAEKRPAPTASDLRSEGEPRRRKKVLRGSAARDLL